MSIALKLIETTPIFSLHVEMTEIMYYLDKKSKKIVIHATQSTTNRTVELWLKKDNNCWLLLFGEQIKLNNSVHLPPEYDCEVASADIYRDDESRKKSIDAAIQFLIQKCVSTTCKLIDNTLIHAHEEKLQELQLVLKAKMDEIKDTI